MSPLRHTAVLVLLFVGIAGCTRSSGKPSEDFDRAHQAFTKLQAQKLDEAYLDPQMDAIEADLRNVPSDSSDAAEARELLERIAQGRKRMQEQAAARQAAAEAALRPADNIPSQLSTSTLPSAAPSGPPDAGPLPQPTAGMTRSEFEKRFGGCFEMGDPVDIEGRGIRDTYRLKDIANCRDRHPDFEKMVVLMEGTSVLAIFPRTSLFSRGADGGAPPAADAGSPPAASDAGEVDGG